MIATDTVLFFDLSKISAGGQFSFEIEYSTLNNVNAVLWIGASNYGNTFQPFADVDSIVLDTLDAVAINGSYVGPGTDIAKRATSPASYMWYLGTDFPFTYFAIRVKPNSVSAGKIYWVMRQK